MAKLPAYTTTNAIKDLDEFPMKTTLDREAEVNRLIEYFPTYKKAHRQGILPGVLQGSTNQEILATKLSAKNIDQVSMSKRSKGGHVHWVVSKLRRAVIRTLFLRICLDNNKSRREANAVLIGHFHSHKATSDGGQSGIRKATQSSLVDSAISKR